LETLDKNSLDEKDEFDNVFYLSTLSSQLFLNFLILIIIIIIIIQERIIQVPKLSKKMGKSSQWMIFVGRIV
jgi:hypothetical protein